MTLWWWCPVCKDWFDVGVTRIEEDMKTSHGAVYDVTTGAEPSWRPGEEDRDGVDRRALAGGTRAHPHDTTKAVTPQPYGVWDPVHRGWLPG